MRYFASLYGVDPDVSKKRISYLLELVGLKDRGEEKVEGYSRGMKQRLHVARTLLHDPEVLFLDEPTIGLDPVGARELRQVILDLQSSKTTILITTMSTCGLGLLLGSVALITVNVMFINNIVYFLLLIFSGAKVPLHELPGWIQMISSALSLTRGVTAARLLVSGASLAEVAPHLWGELAIGVAFSLVGYLMFTVFEIEAKRRGRQELA